MIEEINFEKEVKSLPLQCKEVEYKIRNLPENVVSDYLEGMLTYQRMTERIISVFRASEEDLPIILKEIESSNQLIQLSKIVDLLADDALDERIDELIDASVIRNSATANQDNIELLLMVVSRFDEKFELEKLLSGLIPFSREIKLFCKILIVYLEKERDQDDFKVYLNKIPDTILKESIDAIIDMFPICDAIGDEYKKQVENIL